MWFKRLLFVYYAALLVENTSALPNRHDKSLFGRQPAAGGDGSPVPWRREQPLRNETGLPESIQATSQSTTIPVTISKDEPQTTLASESSNAPSAVTTSLTPSPALASPLEKSNDAPPISTTNSVLEKSTLSPAQEQSSSEKLASTSSTALPIDASSEESTSTALSLSSSVHGSSTDEQLSAAAQTPVYVSSTTPTPPSTPTPTNEQLVSRAQSTVYASSSTPTQPSTPTPTLGPKESTSTESSSSTSESGLPTDEQPSSGAQTTVYVSSSTPKPPSTPTSINQQLASGAQTTAHVSNSTPAPSSTPTPTLGPELPSSTSSIQPTASSSRQELHDSESLSTSTSSPSNQNAQLNTSSELHSSEPTATASPTTSDSQTTTPTRSISVQPIASTTRSLSSLTTSDDNETSTSRLNTIAGNTASLSAPPPASSLTSDMTLRSSPTSTVDITTGTLTPFPTSSDNEISASRSDTAVGNTASLSALPLAPSLTSNMNIISGSLTMADVTTSTQTESPMLSGFPSGKTASVLVSPAIETQTSVSYALPAMVSPISSSTSYPGASSIGNLPLEPGASSNTSFVAGISSRTGSPVIETQPSVSYTSTGTVSPISATMSYAGPSSIVILPSGPGDLSNTSFVAEVSSRTGSILPTEAVSSWLSASTTTANSETLSVSGVNPTSFLLQSSPAQAAYNQTTAQTSSTLETSTSTATGKNSEGSSISSNTFAAVPTTTSTSNATSSVSSPPVPETTKDFNDWNKTSSLSAMKSGTTYDTSALSTGMSSDFNATQVGGLQTTSIPTLRSSTFGDRTYMDTTLATTTSGSSSATGTGLPTSLETTASNAATVFAIIGYGSTNTHATLSSTASATATVVASAPPPLTTSQTAGVAVGGTAGVLFAVVAAVFLARRYYTNRAARRNSTGSIYPKVAYLYDPAHRGSGSGGFDGHSTSALMSGGAGGAPPAEHTYRAPQNSPDYTQRHSTGSMNRFSDPGNPFRDPEDLPRDVQDPVRDSLVVPSDAATAFSAAIAGYVQTVQKTPTTPGYRDMQTFQEPAIPSPTLSPSATSHNHARSAGNISVLSEITQSASSLYTSSSTRYSSLPQYGHHPNYGLASVRETINTNPFAEPFEYDLLMPVDTRSETPDSVMVYAPTPTPRSPIGPVLATRLLAGNASTNSLLSPVAAQSLQNMQGRLNPKASFNSDSTTSHPERFSLAYDSHSGTTYIRPASPHLIPTQPAPTPSPASPSSVPVHRGWDDIRRYSNEPSMPSPVFSPSPLNFSPPPSRLSPPPPLKKRSLIQLRRKEPALAGPGQVMMSSTGHPLTVKIPFTYNQGKGFEAPRASLLAKLNDMGEVRGVSPSLTASDSVYSTDSGTQQKMGEGLHFARAKLSGRDF